MPTGLYGRGNSMCKDMEVSRIALGYQAMNLERKERTRSQKFLSALLKGLNFF